MPATLKQFRQIALSFPGTQEQSHQHHPDFRVAGKIFATLGYPDKNWGMVKLTPEQQEELIHDEPKSFVPAAGAWGRQGSTTVRLNSVKKSTLHRALEAAWRNTAPKDLVKTFKTAGRIKRSPTPAA
jgi:hypothetical protein